MTTPIKDIVAHIKMRSPINPLTGCWVWTGSLTVDGYGQITIGQRRFSVHRVMYERSREVIPTGAQLDHLCRTRACCNPDHLEPVSPRENMMRGFSIQAQNARKTQCIHGHPLTEDNIYRLPHNPTIRQCKICRSRRRFEFLARKAECAA